MTSGAPVSITRVPGAGDWETTVFDGKPFTEPWMRNEKPASVSVPFEKTKACRRRSGTTRMRGATAGAAFVTGAVAGAAPILWAAANVNAAVAKSQTTVRASKRGTNELIAVVPSARSPRNSTPCCGEVHNLPGGD